MKHRRYGFLIAVGIMFLAIGIVGMGWMLHASQTASRFASQVETGFMAAAMVNAKEIHMDADRAVIAEYEGKRVVIHPGNYDALRLLLTQEMAALLFGEMDKKDALRISLCGTSDMYIAPVAGRDAIYVEWTVQGKHCYVRIKGNSIWERMKLFAVEGTGANLNIPL